MNECPLFSRRPSRGARVIAIVGGGFTGVMVMANLLRFATLDRTPLHIVLIERQDAIGEGIAYRTEDPRHLLNVPASRMSAWPDRPDDFVSFARTSDPSVQADDFLQRQLYGRYVRGELLRLAAVAPPHLSAEVVRDEVIALEELEIFAWKIRTSGGRTIAADLAVLAVGHRPPDDPPIYNRWSGPRDRYIANPWDAMALRKIAPEEPVLLIGSGLTAVDVILTLTSGNRTAPIVAISRHGLLPTAHAKKTASEVDLSAFLSEQLKSGARVTASRLMKALRTQVAAASAVGVPWQSVIDSIRSAAPRIWQRLDHRERERFLRHARPYWEIHRHRMAPTVADSLDRLRREKILQIVAGTPISAATDHQGIDIACHLRGVTTPVHFRACWIVNCTGLGTHHFSKTHSFLDPLVEQGVVSIDDLGLGLITDEGGRVVPKTCQPRPDLLIAGILRKATLWESTSVHEIRQQAQQIAQTCVATLYQ